MNETELLGFLQENVLGMRNYLLSPNNQDDLGVEVPAEILGDVVGQLGSIALDTLSAETIETMVLGFEALYAGVVYAGQALKAGTVYKLRREFLPEMREQQPEYAKLLDITLETEVAVGRDKYETFTEAVAEFIASFAT